MTHDAKTDTTIHDLLDHYASRRVDAASDFGEVVSLAFTDGHEQGFRDGLNHALNLFAQWAESLKQHDSAVRRRITD